MNIGIYNTTMLISGLALIIGVSMALTKPSHADECGGGYPEIDCYTYECNDICRMDPLWPVWNFNCEEKDANKLFCAKTTVDPEDYDEQECAGTGSPEPVNCGKEYRFYDDPFCAGDGVETGGTCLRNEANTDVSDPCPAIGDPVITGT